ncbi:pentatricopeptide repeat-containing protein At3g56030, mitochondrial isoform X2 [Euphorbia lathyris]|uniref:pentatricopeptide repeat-containing protein At3g56030, mitochondrial isoform X2 n=1 Tax=Euphorbia lathyris TaxID=212925 RepID=UPI0033135C05
MALFRRIQALHAVSWTLETRESSYLFRASRSYYGLELNSWRTSLCSRSGHNALPWIHGDRMTLQSSVALQLPFLSNDKRFFSTKVKAPPQQRQMGAVTVNFVSPGFVYEPYAPRVPIPLWKRLFTRSGWRRTKDDLILEMKSAYAISRLRKKGYSKKEFYTEAIELYKKISNQLANGDKRSLRKAVTERMYSDLKNEIKQRESQWNKVYWEMIEPVVKIRTLRARMIAVDKNNLQKAFIQLTLEFLTKQKFEAYDAKGTVVAGDKTKECVDHPFCFRPKTMALPYLRKLHSFPNSQSILSTTRFFSTQTAVHNSLPDKPTSSYYDDLINGAGQERDFDKLCDLLNERAKYFCYNTSNTFKFIMNTDASLSVLEDLAQTLARVDNGFPRIHAYNTLIARLCKLGRITESLHIVDIMARGQHGLSKCSFYPILCYLTTKKKMEEAWDVMKLMTKVGVPPDTTAFNYFLTSYCCTGDLMATTKTIKRMEKAGLVANERTYDALVLGACKAGKVEGALVILRKMEEVGFHVLYSSYIHVINAFLKSGYYAQALKFVKIYGGRDASLDSQNFGTLASKLIKLNKVEEAKLVLEEIEERGLVVGNSLRDDYNLKVKNVN